MKMPRTEEENVNQTYSNQPNPSTSSNQERTSLQPTTTTTRRIKFKTRTADQLPGYLQQYGFFVGQEVHVMENISNTIVNANLKWMGTIGIGLYFGLESDCPQLKKIFHFQSYVQQMGNSNGKHDWLITPCRVRPSHRAFIHNDYLHFHSIAGKVFKVIESGEIGIVKWSGKIDGDKMLGLEIMNRNHVSCPIIDKYQELINLFSHSNDHPIMFVANSAVEFHQEMDMLPPRVIFPNDESEFNASSQLEQLRKLANTNGDIVANTSSASTSKTMNPSGEHQAAVIPDCVVCQSELSVYIVIPCGHFCLCVDCHLCVD